MKTKQLKRFLKALGGPENDPGRIDVATDPAAGGGPAESPFLASATEHSATCLAAEDFEHDSFVSVAVQPGVRMVAGVPKKSIDNRPVVAGYRFDCKQMSAEAARSWLADRQIRFSQFDEAKQDQYPLMTCWPELVTFAAAVQLQAASAAGRLPTIDILAYTGGPLAVADFPYPVVVDIGGLEIDAQQTPICKDHKLDQVVGHGQAIKAAGTVRIKGVVSGTGDASKEVLADARNGFQWRASIGCRIEEARLVKAGETLSANGQTFPGPVIYASRARLKEVSVTSSGADDDSQVSIAASAARGKTMKFLSWLKAMYEGENLSAFNPNQDDGGRFASAEGSSKAPHKATGKAERASAKAHASGKDADHDKAADAHDAAQSAHETAAAQHANLANYHAAAGHTEKAQYHRQQASQHRAAAGAHETAAAASAAIDLQANATLTTESSDMTPAELQSMKTLAATELRASYAAEMTRVQAIQKAAQEHRAAYGQYCDKETLGKIADVELKAVGENWSAEKAELEILRLRPKAPAAHVGGADEQFNGEVIEAAAAITGMLPRLEQHYKPEILDLAHKHYRGRMGLQQMLLQAAWANGSKVRFIGDDAALGDVLRHAFVRAEGASTLSLPGLLSNLANKFLLEGFNAVESVWREVASVQSTKDFKPHTSFRFWSDMTYQKLGPAGEMTHGKVGEIRYVNQIDTYARMFSTTRQDIINDDLGAMTDLPRQMGIGAAYALNLVFWTAWLAGLDSQGKAMFPTDNSRLNYMSGAGSALGIEALTQAVQMFREQKNPAGQPLGFPPRKLLVAPANATTADNIRKFPEIRNPAGGPGGKSYTTGNPFVGQFEPVSSSYLSTVYGLPGASQTGWWLLADPLILPAAEVLFLNGQQTPTVQSSEADFHTLGIQHRGFWDFGVSLQEYRAGVYSKGAA